MCECRCPVCRGLLLPQGSRRGVAVGALHRFQRTPVEHHRHGWLLRRRAVKPNPSLGLRASSRGWGGEVYRELPVCFSDETRSRIETQVGLQWEVTASLAVKNRKRDNYSVGSLATPNGYHCYLF